MKEFARAEWQRAKRSLAAAEQLISVDPDSAASRAYYAAFHALSALFALRGKSFKKHSELRSTVHQVLVKGGEISAELGRSFDFLMELRETGDYGALVDVSGESAKLAVARATEIVNAVRSICPSIDKVD